MNAVSDLRPLRLEDTVEVARVNHRLALGVQWIDALTQLPASGDWVSELLAIGARPCLQPLEVHAKQRHALRHAGRLVRVLSAAAADKVDTPPADVADDPTNFQLQGFGRIDTRLSAYATGNDARRYVPRLLSLTPVQAAGVPPATPANIREAWLWPGAAYPLPSHATAIRGRVQRGPSLADATPVPWARIAVTRALGGTPSYAAETKLAFAHGDDRGEFLVVLDARALPGGAALPATVDLRLWVFLPPAGSFDATDPLASLPLELAGTQPLNDVLRGMQMPFGYVPQVPVDLSVRPGEIFTMNETQLLFS